MKSLLLALLLLLPAVAIAQPAPKPPTLADLSKKAVDVLRVLHDRGADLYNAGDAPGAVKVYQTALGAVSPFVAHHPAIQKAIADGLAEAEKADGDKAKAFKLHEVIELVRADLRAVFPLLLRAVLPALFVADFRADFAAPVLATNCRPRFEPATFFRLVASRSAGVSFSHAFSGR